VGDKDLKLWYIDITDKKPVQVDNSRFGEMQDYSWSPDSKWLAYDKATENGNSIVYLYSLDDKKISPITDSMTIATCRSSMWKASIFISSPTATSTKCWVISISICESQDHSRFYRHVAQR